MPDFPGFCSESVQHTATTGKAQKTPKMDAREAQTTKDRSETTGAGDRQPQNAQQKQPDHSRGGEQNSPQEAQNSPQTTETGEGRPTTGKQGGRQRERAETVNQQGGKG